MAIAPIPVIGYSAIYWIWPNWFIGAMIAFFVALPFIILQGFVAQPLGVGSPSLLGAVARSEWLRKTRLDQDLGK